MYRLGNEMEELAEEELDEYLEEEFSSKTEEVLYKKLYRKMMNGLKKKAQLTLGGGGQEVDRLKFQRLIAEYKDFKRNHVQHFRFNSASNQTAFGQFVTTTCATISMLQCFR